MNLWVLLAHVGATIFMTGLIWLIQIVHYPLFGQVGPAQWHGYHSAHTTLITFIVMPVMLVELATAGWLVLERPAAIPAWAALLGAALVGVIWLSTAFLQVPMHNQLGGTFDVAAHANLVNTNWIRTVAWSARTVLVLWMVARLIPNPAT